MRVPPLPLLPIALAAFVALVGATPVEGPETYMGYEVEVVPYTLFDGEIVELRVTEAGAIPAEDERFKVELAGVAVRPDPARPGTATLTWGFGISAKDDAEIAAVTVEEVFPHSAPFRLLHYPDVQESETKRWQAKVEPIEASSFLASWLFTDEHSLFVYRFTIRSADGQVSRLYQLVWYPPQSKAMFRMAIRNIEGG